MSEPVMFDKVLLTPTWWQVLRELFCKHNYDEVDASVSTFLGEPDVLFLRCNKCGKNKLYLY